MPIDPYDEDDEKVRPEDLGRRRRFGEFDCPECNANNPYDDGIGAGDDVRCYYCGQEFRADVTDSGKLKLKAIF